MWQSLSSALFLKQYLILGVLFQSVYVLIQLEETYKFTALFQILSGFESVFCVAMIIDSILVAIGAKRLYTIVSVPGKESEIKVKV